MRKKTPNPEIPPPERVYDRVMPICHTKTQCRQFGGKRFAKVKPLEIVQAPDGQLYAHCLNCCELWAVTIENFSIHLEVDPKQLKPASALNLAKAKNIKPKKGK